MAVDDLPFEACQYACRQIYRSESFMPVPAVLRGYALDWQKRQRQRTEQTQEQQEFLALREALMPIEEVRELIASVLKDDLKDPLPPYAEETP